MGQVLHLGLLQGREPVGVTGLWVTGEDVEAFSKDPFESVGGGPDNK